MKYSFKFFENKDCEYYPCHKGLNEINCLYCSCMCYPYRDCPGTYIIIKNKSGNEIKDCSHCIFPHIPSNYDKINDFIKNKLNSNHM